MNKKFAQTPMIWIFMGCSLLSLPVLIFLAKEYFAAQKPPPFSSSLSLTPLPTPERLLEIVHGQMPLEEDIELKKVYAVDFPIASGVEAMYYLGKKGTVLYRLVVFRDDISCSTCRDILAAVAYEVSTDAIAQIFLIDPWEVRGEAVDAQTFLAQFVKKSAATFFEIGKNIDGISGATYSTQGLVKRLNGVSVWIAQQPLPKPEVAKTANSTEGG